MNEEKFKTFEIYFYQIYITVRLFTIKTEES